MPTIRKPADYRRAEIVTATLGLLTVTPVEKLTTERIARQVGITQAAIFRHFPTKEALWVAVLETVERRAVAAWDAAIAEGHGPLERLRLVLRAQLALVAAVPAVPVLIFNAGRMAAETAIRPVHMRVTTGFRARIAEELRGAMAEGTVRAGLPPEDGADLFLGLVQGMVLRWQLTGRKFDLVAEGIRLVDMQIDLIACNSSGR